VNAFLSELRRRKVYRVAGAYAVVAWLIIQVAATVFPVWDMPVWTLRFVIALVLMGFPVALLLSWALDFTPEGIRVETPGPATSALKVGRRRYLFLLGGFGMVVAAGAAFLILPRAAAHRVDKSIAVLPFDNLSDDKENAYFADGIQDDVLTNLSKIGELKVISRTSVMGYRGHKGNAREIAKALGVGAILEGSVRRSGNTVRVNVQLINGRTDEHMWSEIYDRDLTDVFAIQNELAREIASQLQMKLSPSEKARLEQRPTDNGEAYLVHLQARNIFNHPDRSVDDLRRAEQLYYRAIELDPQFALAYADLSRLQSWLYHGGDHSPDRIEKAKAAAEEALRLQPELPEAHLAAGYCYYYGDRDYDRALAEFAIAQRGLPNDAAVYLAIAAIERRQGKWERSTANFEKAGTLNPKDAILWQNLAMNYAHRRKYDAAVKAYDRAVEAAPDSTNLLFQRARLQMEQTGDPAPVERVIAATSEEKKRSPEAIMSISSYLFSQRDYDRALQLLLSTPDELLEAKEPDTPKAFYLAELYHAAGDTEKARAAYETSRVALEAAVRERPRQPALHAKLGVVYAGLGRAEDAIRAGRTAMELLPESRDAFDGPMWTKMMAEIYANVGRADDAVALLDHLLTIPSSLSVRMLQVDPSWDAVREDPRFKALLAKHGAAS
jgi:TolB-like protein/predicted Zn-dependent protease